MIFNLENVHPNLIMVAITLKIKGKARNTFRFLISHS